MRHENPSPCGMQEEGDLWHRYKPDMPFVVSGHYKVFACLAEPASVRATASAFVDGQLIEAHGEGPDHTAAKRAAEDNVQLQMQCSGPTH